MKTFLHSGDRGDSIYSLPVIRDNGPGILCVADKPWTNPITPWIESARKLIEAQPYISALKIHQGEAINHDFSTFRKIGHHQGRTIAELHATWTRLPCDINKPWLTVEPNPDMAGKIVVNRTPRYNNEFFPWKRLVYTFSEDMVFIGLPQEHQAFCDQYGKVPYLPTNDLYEVAAAIAGSEVYMANQSVGYAICEGLKHRSIQETHLQWADCIYARDNATYCFDGFLSFEACGKHFENPAVERRQKVVTSITPPGGYVEKYNPVYCRVLPNCLEPKKIPERCIELQGLADAINPNVVFVQYKPPAAPKNCWLGWVHPVLTPSGAVLPCDSCCLNPSAKHKFANPWVIAQWDTIGEMYKRKIHSLVDSERMCPGCVFTQSNAVLEYVVNGGDVEMPELEPMHSAFI